MLIVVTIVVLIVVPSIVVLSIVDVSCGVAVWSVAVLAVLLITTLGLITCVVSHYKGTTRPCHPAATPTTTPVSTLTFYNSADKKVAHS